MLPPSLFALTRLSSHDATVTTSVEHAAPGTTTPWPGAVQPVGLGETGGVAGSVVGVAVGATVGAADCATVGRTVVATAVEPHAARRTAAIAAPKSVAGFMSVVTHATGMGRHGYGRRPATTPVSPPREACA